MLSVVPRAGVYKIKKECSQLHSFFAERTRFELVVGLLLRQFSKLVVSATHPPLQGASFPNCECKVTIIFCNVQ